MSNLEKLAEHQGVYLQTRQIYHDVHCGRFHRLLVHAVRRQLLRGSQHRRAVADPAWPMFAGRLLLRYRSQRILFPLPELQVRFLNLDECGEPEGVEQ